MLQNVRSSPELNICDKIQKQGTRKILSGVFASKPKSEEINPAKSQKKAAVPEYPWVPVTQDIFKLPCSHVNLIDRPMCKKRKRETNTHLI